jgi:K+-sensing histidine kinase KdpD
MIQRLKPYAFATLLADAVVGLLLLTRPYFDDTTAALVMVLAVTTCALLWKSGPALWASIICLLCFNYFFLRPFGTFSIGAREDVVAFIAFSAIAILMGQLSARAEKRTAQAEARRVEIEALYQKLRLADDAAAEAELLRRSEKLKAALLDAVTHDLRTPLTSIKAAVTTVLSELPTSGEPLRDLLQIIDEESDRLNRFIEEMMALARFEGDPALRPVDTSVNEIIDAALERSAPLLSQHKVEVSIEDQLPLLRVDPNSLAQAVYSLLDNAAKYSPRGSHITLQAGQERNGIFIRVADEGIGIQPDYREKVFEKFFRISNSSVRPGFGLGLSIAKRIVEAHGGNITISSPGSMRGTVVTVVLPVTTAALVAQTA